MHDGWTWNKNAHEPFFGKLVMHNSLQPIQQLRKSNDHIWQPNYISNHSKHKQQQYYMGKAILP